MCLNLFLLQNILRKFTLQLKNSASYLPGAAKGSYGSIVGITSGG